MKELLEKLKQKHPILYQFISFAGVGGVVTVVDFALFALCRYLVFTAYLDTPFQFFIFDYPVQKGGLCAFLAFVISFPLAQVVSFLLQRNFTFKANNNTAASAAMFTCLIIFIFLVNMYLPVLTLGLLTRFLSPSAASIIAKCINMTTSMLIEFPIDKYVIMRRKTTKK